MIYVRYLWLIPLTTKHIFLLTMYIVNLLGGCIKENLTQYDEIHKVYLQ